MKTLVLLTTWFTGAVLLASHGICSELEQARQILSETGVRGGVIAHLQSLGVYGPVSVETLAGDRLPYVDNFVNLVVAEDLGRVPREEVLRVLAPNGVAYLKSGGSWSKTIKPRPAAIDEWTHYLHSADNNAVATDTQVGPPRHCQWLGGPKWSRHHDHMSSMNAMVTANGRLFYIMDEGPTAAIMLPQNGSWPPATRSTAPLSGSARSRSGTRISGR